ncbi:anthranilate synthase family protein [Streptomyces sp. NPDC060311]|uniref:anthranilate synthase family protein n=1 Tax=Streptomyces sp. NPDC060311 TaxID=3347096 RepID=UPI00365B1FE9
MGRLDERKPGGPLGRLYDGGPFALVHRPGMTAPGVLELFRGPVAELSRLAELPVDHAGAPAAGPAVLALVPFRQVAERGYACVDDGAPLLAMRIEQRSVLGLDAFLRTTRDTDVPFEAAGFDLGDDRYAEIVRDVLAREIGTGAGSNFVIARSWSARLRDPSVATELTLFRRLLTGETGAHWTFLVHTGRRTFVGASPERHVGLGAGEAVMNPISGTYRYPADGPTVDGLLGFLADRKEVEELYMVVDEELKMMAGICHERPHVDGPYLRRMRHLAHTEYFVRGRTALPAHEILRRTLLAPTVTGSPVQNACTVLTRHEPVGRGYYSGVAALIGRDCAGAVTMDSTILIRTAELTPDARLRLGVGATLVRHSDPVSEVAETHAKAAGFLSALRGGQRSAAVRTGAGPDPVRDPRVRRLLRARNEGLARFWLSPSPRTHWAVPELTGLRALVVDGEDTFTAMLAHQLRALGLTVTVASWRDVPDHGGHDLVVAGPGPGDPGRLEEPRIARLHTLVGELLALRKPLLAVCLSHQVLCRLIGLDVRCRPEPNQGVRRRIDLFGEPADVGFYNTFSAWSPVSRTTAGPGTGPVEIGRDEATGEVHALRGPAFASVQFHPESVLTEHGPRLIRGLLAAALRTGAPAVDRVPDA